MLLFGWSFRLPVFGRAMELIFYILGLIVGWWPFRKTRSTVASLNFPQGRRSRGNSVTSVCIWLPIAGWIPLMVRPHDGWVTRWKVV